MSKNYDISVMLKDLKIAFFEIYEQYLKLKFKYRIRTSLNFLLLVSFGRFASEITTYGYKLIDIIASYLQKINVAEWKIIFLEIVLNLLLGGNILSLTLFGLIFLVFVLLKVLEIVYGTKELEPPLSQLFQKPIKYIERKVIRLDHTLQEISSINSKIPLPLLSVVCSDKNKISILGEAGSGKSTELENIAWTLNENNNLFPCFIRLRNYINQDISSFLPPGWEAIGKDKLIVILDGFDEIEGKNRNDAKRQINNFTQNFPEIKIIISCRRNFYNVELKDSHGTLQGFVTYEIVDLSDEDIREFIKKELGDKENEFMGSLNRAGITNLLKNPFYLIHLVVIFSRNNELPSTKSDIFENLFEARFSFDDKHYTHSFNLRESKVSINKLLERVGLAMELLGRNYITEEEFQELIEAKNDRELIKSCTAFTKKEEGKWQFEHNNFNEYFASKALSKQNITTIKSFIAFSTPAERIKPTWVNTISFLIDLFPQGLLLDELIGFILNKDLNIAFKFEDDKISPKKRNEIFKKIFKYYKEKDIWINFSKYTEANLAKFSKSQETINFLLEEITSPNTRIVKLNAIHLLGYFNLENINSDNVKDVLLNLLDDDSSDNNFKHSIITALTNSKLNNENTIKVIIKKVGQSEDSYIRASLYYTLLQSNILDDNIEIFIDGYKIYQKRRQEDRANSLMNEYTNLKEGFKKVKSTIALKKVLSFIITINSSDFEHTRTDSILECLVTNGIEAFYHDSTIFNNFYDLLIKSGKNYNQDMIKCLLNFFDETVTREKVYKALLSIPADERSGMLLAIVSNLELLNLLIEKYNANIFSDEDIKSIIWDIRQYNTEIYSEFERLIKENTNYNIVAIPDHYKIRKLKDQSEFDLLFTPDEFRKKVHEIVGHLNKEILSFDEIYDLEEWHNPSPLFPHIVLEYLWKSAREQNITKTEIDDILNNEKKFNDELIGIIHGKLESSQDLVVNNFQKEFIFKWFSDNVEQFSFQTAYYYQDGIYSVEAKAIYIWFFYRKFHFNLSEIKLLDMLSFDWDDNNKMVGIDYLESEIEESKITERIKKNLESDIMSEDVLKNHVEYILRHNLTENYSFIIQEIVNKKRNEVKRIEIFDLYFNKTHATSSIIENLPQIDNKHVKWHIIDRIWEYNPSLISEYLQNLFLLEQSIETRLIVAEYLIEINDISALDFYINWIIENKHLPNGRFIGKNLDKVISIDSLPYLMKLLKFHYQESTTQDHFNRTDAIVLHALFRIGVVSESNFIKVYQALHDFINENKSQLDNVKFLNFNLERLEDEFYLTKTENFTIDQVVEKLKVLSL